MNHPLSDESFAIELAESLEDTGSLPFYRKCVEQYPEEILRQIQSKVLSIPKHKIRKTRGALFNSLLSSHGKAPRHPWS